MPMRELMGYISEKKYSPGSLKSEGTCEMT